LTFEVEAWRKKAEADGSLFDLKKGSVKVITTTIAGNVSLHRLTGRRDFASRRGAVGVDAFRSSSSSRIFIAL
jgi:hypothetical protein